MKYTSIIVGALMFGSQAIRLSEPWNEESLPYCPPDGSNTMD